MYSVLQVPQYLVFRIDTHTLLLYRKRIRAIRRASVFSTIKSL